MKLENKALIGLGLTIFIGIVILLGIVIRDIKSDLKPIVAKDSLTLELEQTRVKYEKWKKDQAKKDSITRMKVEMGEVEESWEDFRLRLSRESDRRIEEIWK